MTLLKKFVVCGALIGSVSFVVAEDKPAEKKEEKVKFDASKMVGKWTVSEGSKNGTAVEPKSIKEPIVITKDKITMVTPDATFEFKYKLDEKADPVTIDLEITSDVFKGSKAPGIIKFDGDKLMLAYGVNMEDMDKTARPKEFGGKKDSNSYSYVFTKAKEEKKDK
jgi:uncharacterized protein (TIGR03067 family)